MSFDPASRLKQSAQGQSLYSNAFEMFNLNFHCSCRLYISFGWYLDSTDLLSCVSNLLEFLHLEWINFQDGFSSCSLMSEINMAVRFPGLCPYSCFLWRYWWSKAEESCCSQCSDTETVRFSPCCGGSYSSHGPRFELDERYLGQIHDAIGEMSKGHFVWYSESTSDLDRPDENLDLEFRFHDRGCWPCWHQLHSRSLWFCSKLIDLLFETCSFKYWTAIRFTHGFTWSIQP